MNREFEKQYRAYMEGQAPDLWDRIESGLKDKTGPAEETEQEEQEIFRRGNFGNGNSGKGRIPAVRRKRMAGIFGAAAAVMVLCFAMPRMFIHKGDWSGGYSSGAGEAAQNGMSPEYNEMAGGAASYEDAAREPQNEEGGEGSISDTKENPGKDRIRLKVRIDRAEEAADAGYSLQCYGVVLDMQENPGEPMEEVSFYVDRETKIPEGESLETGRECEVVLRQIEGEEMYVAEEIRFP